MAEADGSRMDSKDHPAQRMITVLDWWLADHFDKGRNPRIANAIIDLKEAIWLEIDLERKRGG